MEPQTEATFAAPLPTPANPARRGSPHYIKSAGLIAGGLIALLLIMTILGSLFNQSNNAMFYTNTSSMDGPAPAAGEAGTVADNTTKAPASQDWDRKIIRNGTMSLQVQNVANSIAAVRDVAAQAGGIVFSSSSQYEGDDLLATVTIQVPAAQFDAALSNLRRLGIKVLSEATTSQDVTEEFVDLSSQLKNLQAQEDQLRQLMTKATTVDETLQVQRELGTVRGQIEQIQGRINYINRRADMSSIVVTLSPKPLPVAAVSNEWDPASTVQNAWNNSLRVLTGLGDLLIGIVVFCWWLVPLLLLAWLLLRGRLARRSGISS